MPFEPEKITAQHIFDAVKKIESEKIQLNVNNDYEVIINGKPYPPKEIMRYAHQQANGDLLWMPSGGPPTNQYLEDFGFQIVQKSNFEFTWVESHKKIARWLTTFENNQPGLISILKEIGLAVAEDENEAGDKIELSEIDPFTFIAYVYKHGYDKCLHYLRKLCSALSIEPIPNDVKGVPTAYAQQVWLFPYKKSRGELDIPNLWELFKAALVGTVKNELFARVLEIKNTGRAKITEGLFYVSPDSFLPINAQTKPYLRDNFGIDPNFETFGDYVKILQQLRSQTSDPLYKISYDAYQWNKAKGETRYLIFQGDSDNYDFETAFKTELLTTWKVGTMKDKIKPGDKVIFWISGKNSGCYGLGEVTTSPQTFEKLPDAHLLKQKHQPDSDRNVLRAGIKITHNLVSSPIVLNEVKSNEQLKDLKLGVKETNFVANEKQFKALLKLAEIKLNKRYWLYAPGEGAEKWDEFYANGIMALEREQLGDLSQYDKDGIAQVLRSTKKGSSSQSNNSLGYYNFRYTMKAGDVVIPKKGVTAYLGYGIVTSDYYFDDKPEDFKHFRKVNWIKKGEWKEEHGQIVSKALTDITDLSTDVPGYNSYVDRLKQLIGIDGVKVSNMPYSKNIILYGPPGTGKTYHSIDKAVEIASGDFSTNHIENKKLFDELRSQGQIEFVTFHQNYSYEDFIIGLRPDIEFENLRFKSHKGIFYEMCRKARENYESYISKTGRKRSFEEVLQELLQPLESGQEVEIKMASGISFWLTEVSNTSINFRKHSGGTNHTLSLATLKYLIEDKRDLPTGLGSYYKPLVGVLQQRRNKKTVAEPYKNFVLIIDEINRANISKVFGELITLLEDDKRLGQENELKITLPNGERDFGVPPNFYIIGTMNTADKSIALIDIAFRRRFDFIGFYPKYEGYDPDAVSLLQNINATLYVKKKSADYLIGHAYFMNQQPIEKNLKNKVIPLLMEYFSGNTKIVSEIFDSSGWSVEYDPMTYDWIISKS